MKDTLIALGERCLEADAAYRRILDNGPQMSPNGAAIAGAMVLAMHGHLFKECAAALKALASHFDGGV